MSKEWDWSEYDSWDQKGKSLEEFKEIKKILDAVSLLVNHCTHNLNPSQLKEVDSRIKSTIDQCIFWEKNDNTPRLIYDLRAFGVWLADFISEAEEEYWKDK